MWCKTIFYAELGSDFVANWKHRSMLKIYSAIQKDKLFSGNEYLGSFHLNKNVLSVSKAEMHDRHSIATEILRL